MYTYMMTCVKIKRNEMKSISGHLTSVSQSNVVVKLASANTFAFIYIFIYSYNFFDFRGA